MENHSMARELPIKPESLLLSQSLWKNRNEEKAADFHLKLKSQSFNFENRNYGKSIKKGIGHAIQVIWLVLFRFYCESPVVILAFRKQQGLTNFQVKNELPNRMASAANDSFTEESSSEKVK